MSNIEITLTGADGSHSTFHNDWDVCEARGLLHIENLEGWIGGVGADVVPDLKRFQHHGKFPGRTVRNNRKMDLTLSWHRSIHPDQDAYTAFARAASAIAWGEGPYRMRVVEDGFALNTDIQLDGEPNFQPIVAGSEQAFRIRIPTRASDPYLYGDPRVTTIGGYRRVPALRYDLFGQGWTNVDGEQVLGWSEPDVEPALIWNSGTVPAYPTFELVGSTHQGVRVTLNSKSVEFRGSLSEASPLLLDFSGSAVINGVDHSAQLVRRDWSAVEPGIGNYPLVEFLGEQAYGYANATHRDVFI